MLSLLKRVPVLRGWPSRRRYGDGPDETDTSNIGVCVRAAAAFFVCGNDGHAALTTQPHGGH